MRQFVLLAVASLFLAGCSESDPAEDPGSGQTQSSSSGAGTTTGQTTVAGFDSPQAAFDAIKAAAERDDFPGAVRCMTPESQKIMAMMMTLPLAMIAAFDPDKEKEIEALMQRHGLSLEDESEEFPADQIPDQIAFITDVLEFLEANSDGEEEDSPISKMADATLENLEVDGTKASAVISSAEGESEDIEFVQIDGRWFVQIPDPMGGAEADFSGDMEFGGGFGGSGFQDEPAIPITAVTLEEFNAAWQVTLQETDADAGELLAQLSTEMGLTLSADGITEQLQKKVSIDLVDVSRYEAIETICRELGVTPVFEEDELMFEPAPRATPVVFSGPFAVFVRDLSADPETATGMLNLQVVAHGIPAVVLQQMEEGFDDPLIIVGAMDADGESLENPAATGISFSGTPAESFDREAFIGLRNLLKAVESIGSVELEVAFSIPTAVETLEFDDLKPDTTLTAGDMELTLTEVDGASFTFEYVGSESDGIQLIGYSEDGTAQQPFSSSTFGGGGSGTIAYEYEDSPVRFEARIVTAMEELSFPLNLENVPLPNHAQMPDKLPELTFEGESPVTLEFVRLGGQEGFREAVFRATNHSNKAVGAIDVLMSYQNDSGEELENQSMQWQGDPIAQGGSAEIEVGAYFMPEEATKVVGQPEAVTFTDASLWEMDE